MNDKKTTHQQEIIEIADTLFAYPDRKKADIMRNIAEKCGKSPRTIERWIAKAEEYNQERLRQQEVAKSDVMVNNAVELTRAGVLTRGETVRILSDIAKGETREVSGEVIVPSASEQVRAIQQLSKMEGWDTPNKVDITSGGRAINEPTEVIFRHYDGRDNKNSK